jgi:hypothetical protein
VEGLGLEEKRRACGVFWRGSGERQGRERERDAGTHSGRLGCGGSRRDAVATERKGFRIRVEVEGLGLEERRTACGFSGGGAGKAKSERERKRERERADGCGCGGRDALPTDARNAAGTAYMWWLSDPVGVSTGSE